MLVLCGEFQELGSAYYHPAVNHATLGYGDVLMTPAWRLLGPLEATNGALMFGVSAAMVFAVVQRLVLAKFEIYRRLNACRNVTSASSQLHPYAACQNRVRKFGGRSAQGSARAEQDDFGGAEIRQTVTTRKFDQARRDQAPWENRDA